MAKTRQQKEQEVAALTDILSQGKSAVFVSYDRLGGTATTSWRQQLRKEGVQLTMIKKRLLKLVLQNAGLDGAVVDTYEGNISVAVSETDEVAPAKAVAGFAKANDTVKIQGGILEQALIDSVAVTALAELPSKQELLAKVVGTLNAPITGFVGALNGNLRNIVYVLNAIKEQKSTS